MGYAEGHQCWDNSYWEAQHRPSLGFLLLGGPALPIGEISPTEKPSIIRCWDISIAASPIAGITPIGRPSITNGLPHHEGWIHPNPNAQQNPALCPLSHISGTMQGVSHPRAAWNKGSVPRMGRPPAATWAPRTQGYQLPPHTASHMAFPRRFKVHPALQTKQSSLGQLHPGSRKPCREQGAI